MTTAPQTLIFLHIPKTGGTTLHKILERRYPRDQILSFDGRNHRHELENFISLAAAERARYRLIKGHLSFGLHRHVPGRSTYVTLLREPIARTLSFYHYVRTHPEHYLYESVQGQGERLKSILKQRMTQELFNEQTRMIAGGEWKDPQREVDQMALEQAKENLRLHFGVVGLMEHFDASLLLLCRTFSWNAPLYMRKNVTARTADNGAIDPETLALLQRANALDTELYKFARELFNAQRRAMNSSFDSELKRFQRLNHIYAGAFESCLRLRDGAVRLLTSR